MDKWQEKFFDEQSLGNRFNFVFKYSEDLTLFENDDEELAKIEIEVTVFPEDKLINYNHLLVKPTQAYTESLVRYEIYQKAKREIERRI